MSAHISEVLFHPLGRRDWSVTWRRTGLPWASPTPDRNTSFSSVPISAMAKLFKTKVLLIVQCWGLGVGFTGHWGFHLFLSPPQLPAFYYIDCMMTGLNMSLQGYCCSVARSCPTLCDSMYYSWRINAFELWCWRRLLRVPWITRRSSQSILKEISPEYSLEGLMLKLKLQYFGHLIRTADSLEKTLMLGNIEGRRRRRWQRIRWLDSTTDVMDMSLSSSGSWWWTGKSGVLQSMGSQRVRHDWAIELNWTELYYNMPGFPVLHYLPELAQIHVHRVRDAIQQSRSLLSPSPVLNLSQHQDLFQWVGCSNQVAKILELKLKHRRRQWHPTPVLLPGKSHGWRSLVGCSPWGR